MKKRNARVKFFIWEKGPVAKAILYSYLLVLLVPLLLTVAITAVTISQLREQSARHVASTATELSRLMDAYIEEIQAENTRILFSDEVKKVSVLSHKTPDKQDILQLRSLQRRLPVDTVASEYIHAIYICFLKNGTMLTGSSVYYDYNFNFMLRDQLGMSLDYWMSFVNSTVADRVSLVIGDLDHRAHFLVAKRFAPMGGNSDVVVVSEFSSDKAVRLMNEFSENGALLHSLHSENGTVLNSSFRPTEDTSYYEVLTPLHTSDPDLSLFIKTQVPNNRFLHQTMPLLLTLLLCFIFFIALGFVLIHYLTRRQYSPIEQLNNSLLKTLNRSEAEARNGDEKNEFDQMSEAVSLLLKTNASSRKENELLRESVRRHLLQGVLYGTFRKSGIILRHAENNGISFVGQRFLVVLYSIEDMQQSEYFHLLLQNENVISPLGEILRVAINRCCDNGSTRYAVEVDEQVACIINPPDSLNEEQLWSDVLGNVQRIRDFFRNSFGVLLSAAVSRLHTGVTGITSCFWECREVADYMEMIGTYPSVYRYDHLPAVIEDTLSFSEVLEKEKKLCRSLSAGDYQTAKVLWAEMQDVLSLRTCSPQEARARLLGVISLMSSVLSELPPEIPCSITRAFSVEQLQRHPDLDGMLATIRDALSELAEFASRDNMPQGNVAEQQFICYVNENLTDPNLSVSVIADHFNMSPSYFSKRFKKASGENLLDYIHRERLNLVKQLMQKKPDSTLKELCDLVGYTSPLTLNRAFRKYEGITPSDYRAQL